VGQRRPKSCGPSGRVWGTWWDKGQYRQHCSGARGGMSPGRKEMAWQGGRLVHLCGTERVGFSCGVWWLSLLPSEGLCWGGGVVVELHADSKSAMRQPHLTLCTYWGLSGIFWRVSEVFQPCFALAARNAVHIVLTISLSASMRSAYLAVLGALGQA